MSNWKHTITKRLNFIYNNNLQSEISEKIVRLIEKNISETNDEKELWNEKDIALITYGDTIIDGKEKPLDVFQKFAKNHLKDTFSVIHILPFFPFSSDDGFSVIDFKQVNPDLGNWKQINEIGSNYKLMADLVINHVSSQSDWFKNFLKGEGIGSDFFIETSPGEDLSEVTRPRSTPLLTEFDTQRGKKYVWTTFSDDQIDLNFENPEVLCTFIEILLYYLNRGIKIIRLDAIAFLWKEKGPCCLHLAKTHEIVKLLRDVVDHTHPGTILITETNVPNKENMSYFGENDEAHMVYQFSLPPLLLHALYSGNGKYLNKWAKTIPELNANCTFFNFTSSHDGIGVRPLEGLLPENEKQELFKSIKKSGGLISMKSNIDGTESPYELNITYFDSLKYTKFGDKELQLQRFLCSQTIALAMKGLPAIYIHSLLASGNNIKGVEETGRARTINREQLEYSVLQKELKEETTRSIVFNKLLNIIKKRKEIKAFHPSAKQKIVDIDERLFIIYRFTESNDKLLSISNLTSSTIKFSMNDPEFRHFNFDWLTGNTLEMDNLNLSPYQTIWASEK